MTKKRFIKLMMAEGFKRNAVVDATKKIYSQHGYSYDEAYHKGCAGEADGEFFMWLGVFEDNVGKCVAYMHTTH